MKVINTVIIRIFRHCARCGKEEDPEVIERIIIPAITYDEEHSRMTVEVLYAGHNDKHAPDKSAILKPVEKQ